MTKNKENGTVKGVKVLRKLRMYALKDKLPKDLRVVPASIVVSVGRVGFRGTPTLNVKLEPLKAGASETNKLLEDLIQSMDAIFRAKGYVEYYLTSGRKILKLVDYKVTKNENEN